MLAPMTMEWPSSRWFRRSPLAAAWTATRGISGRRQPALTIANSSDVETAQRISSRSGRAQEFGDPRYSLSLGSVASIVDRFEVVEPSTDPKLLRAAAACRRISSRCWRSKIAIRQPGQNHRVSHEGEPRLGAPWRSVISISASNTAGWSHRIKMTRIIARSCVRRP